MNNVHEIVELAWKDSVSFNDIYKQYGISENEVKTYEKKPKKRIIFCLEKKSSRKIFNTLF